MNFKPFADETTCGNNIIFLPKNIHTDFKEIFINTCDAMIHARNDGETFGLSIAEFSIKNKPIITWRPNIFHNPLLILKTLKRYLLKRNYIYATAHLDFLGKKAIKYSTKKNLANIFLNFEKYHKNINYDCYSELFNEENVMRMFNNILGNHNLVASNV